MLPQTNQLTGLQKYFRMHLRRRLRYLLFNRIWNGTYTEMYLSTKTHTRCRINMDEQASCQVIRDWQLVRGEGIEAKANNLKPSVRGHWSLYEIYPLEPSASSCDTQPQAGKKWMTYFITQLQRCSFVSYDAINFLQTSVILQTKFWNAKCMMPFNS